MGVYTENKRVAKINEARAENEKKVSSDVRKEFGQFNREIRDSERRQLEELETSRRNREESIKNMVQEVFGGTEALQYNYEFRKLSDFIGLDPDFITRYADHLSEIKDWAMRKARSKDIVKALGVVKGLKKSMGMNEVGETALKKIYQYIRLESDMTRMKEEQELLKD